MTDFATLVRDARERLGLDPQAMAEYLGVPVYTLRKWEAGTRTPTASAVRLIEVLGIVEALAPALHAGMVPSGSRKRARVAEVPT